INPVAAASSSGSNNLKRIKGKTAFFSLENICLSELFGPLPLFMKESALLRNGKYFSTKTAFFRGEGFTYLLFFLIIVYNTLFYYEPEFIFRAGTFVISENRDERLNLIYCKGDFADGKRSDIDP
ncbi:hypothetical protein ACQCUR_16380, partial [Rossellomorea vietnamensis]